MVRWRVLVALAAAAAVLTPSAPAAAATPKVIYLTFDDGPAPHTPQVLDVLQRHGAKATFFVLGQQVRSRPRTVARIAREGHLLANHTWNHPDLTRLGRADVLSQLRRTQAQLGVRRSRCMRPPYGATNAQVRRWTKQAGLRTVLWHIDTQDWQRPGARTIADRVTGRARSGAVVLMHDGGGDRSTTVAALKIMLPKLKKRGYVFRVLPGCR